MTLFTDSPTTARADPPGTTQAIGPEPLRPKGKSTWLLRPLISAGLLYWMIQRAEPGEILRAIGGGNLRLLLIAFMAHFLGFYLSAVRWRTLLRARGSDASLRFLVESYVVSVFFNNFLPSIIGGDVYRAYDSHRLGQSKSDAFAIVVVDRVLGLLSLLLFAGTALWLSPQALAIPSLHIWIAIPAAGLAGIIAVAFFPPKWLRDAAKNRTAGRVTTTHSPINAGLSRIVPKQAWQLLRAFVDFEGHGVALGKGFMLSLLLQANVVLHYYLVATALGTTIPIAAFFLIVPLAMLIMMLPISVNGIGVRETVFVFFFAAFGESKATALAFSWLLYGMVVLLGILGGVMYAIRKAPST